MRQSDRDKYARQERLTEARERLEEAALSDDNPQVDYRDLLLVMSEMRELERRAGEVLYTAQRAVQALLDVRYPSLMAEYDDLKDRETWYSWEVRFADSLVQDASDAVMTQLLTDRTPCPLCGGLPQTLYYTPGFKVPEGLYRHLTGSYNARQCIVMEVLDRIALHGRGY